MPRVYNQTDPLERFMTHVYKTDFCWNWTASLRSTYGQFYAEGRIHSAPRWIYERIVGPIPDGKEIDHLCRNRICVKPSHLEAVMRSENSLRGDSPERGGRFLHHLNVTNNPSKQRAASMTHCKRGHVYSGENVGLEKRTNGQHYRICLVCRRQLQRSSRAAKRAEAEAKTGGLTSK